METNTPKELTEETLALLIKIGAELSNIETAIKEFQIGYSNKNFGLETYGRYDYLNQPLFKALSKRREALRAQLNHINDSLK